MEPNGRYESTLLLCGCTQFHLVLAPTGVTCNYCQMCDETFALWWLQYLPGTFRRSEMTVTSCYINVCRGGHTVSRIATGGYQISEDLFVSKSYTSTQKLAAVVSLVRVLCYTVRQRLTTTPCLLGTLGLALGCAACSVISAGSNGCVCG